MSASQTIVIIGSGVAGLSAGICLARVNLKVIIITGRKFGGQIIDAVRIDNCPGFEVGISGRDMVNNMFNHIKSLKDNVLFIEKDVENIDFTKYPFNVELDNGDIETANAIIVATGKSQNKLNIDDIDRYVGYGLSYCAVCDGPFYVNKKVCIVGGGDSAVKNAIFLADIAKEVHIFVRRNIMAATSYNKQLLKTKVNIFVHFNTEILKINGEKYVEDIDIVSNNVKSNMKVDGIFVMIGSSPNTDFLNNSIKLDEEGYIITDNICMTNIPGVFAAGDVQSNTYKQVPVAIGNGFTAAMSAFKFLMDR